MNESGPIVVAGINVGNSKLDVHLLEGGVDRGFRNDRRDCRAVSNRLLRHGVTRTVFEPTGRCLRYLRQCLSDAGIETVLVHPLRSRRFARAFGRLAKNDPVDAGKIAFPNLLSPGNLLDGQHGSIHVLREQWDGRLALFRGGGSVSCWCSARCAGGKATVAVEESARRWVKAAVIQPYHQHPRP